MITTDLYYPEGLPNAQREDHGMEAVSPFSRTPMDSGRSRSRPRFTSVPTMATFNWKFTDQQAQMFESWFRDTINNGAAWFNIKYKTPLGMSLLVCKFATMYKGPILLPLNRWGFSATMEVWERPLLALGWGNFPEFIRYADIIDLAMNREWPET